jgi:hypothetical protein
VDEAGAESTDADDRRMGGPHRVPRASAGGTVTGRYEPRSMHTDPLCVLGAPHQDHKVAA